MLVGIETHLINLQALSVILVIEVAEHKDALGRIFQREAVEVEQHHLTAQTGQRLLLTVVVGKTDLEHARLHNLALVNGLRLSGCNDAGIVHTLDSNIVQVLTTQSTRIERVP